MSTAELPSPTTDLEQQRRDLAAHGYCLVADALSADALAGIEQRLSAQARAEADVGASPMEGPNQTIGNLMDKGEEFWSLVLHPVVDDLIGWLIGPEAIVSSSLGKLVSKGGEPGFTHNDQGYVDIAMIEPLVANVMWMISEFTGVNGGTQLVPGSHRKMRVLGEPVEEEAWVSAEGTPGTAMVFDGRLTHRTGVNVTDARRMGVLTYWCRPWIRQQENMVASLRAETVASMPESVKRRIGFEVYRSLGGVDLSAQTSDLVDRSARRVGRLD